MGAQRGQVGHGSAAGLAHGGGKACWAILYIQRCGDAVPGGNWSSEASIHIRADNIALGARWSGMVHAVRKLERL